MLLAVPAGRHTVEFRYVTPGFRAGFIISAATVLGFVLSIFIRKRKQSGSEGKNE